MRSASPAGRATSAFRGRRKLDLLDLLVAQAARQGRRFSPDPPPRGGRLLSARTISPSPRPGCPPISFDSGEDLVNGGVARGEALARDYTDKRYHQPDDEYTRRWDFSGIADDAALLHAVGRGLANGTSWPQWSEDSEFRAARDRSAAERGAAPAPAARRAESANAADSDSKGNDMTEALEFYTNPMSRGQIVRWMLEEVGEPYETHILDYKTTMKAEDYLAINPMGKVPAIRHNGRVVTEVAAICCYLADAFPAAGLAPPPTERADYYRWLFFAAGPVEAAFSNKAAGFEADARARRRCSATALTTWPWTTLENAVSAGATTSPATGSPPPTCSSGAMVGFMLQFELLEPRPAFTDYVARVTDRPAYRPRQGDRRQADRRDAQRNSPPEERPWTTSSASRRSNCTTASRTTAWSGATSSPR